MSQPTKSPCFIAGTPRSSGDPFTGELLNAHAGGRTATLYSGLPSGSIYTDGLGAVRTASTANGGDLLLWSGAGRLNSLLVHTLAVSGQNAIFYDASVATSGGPFQASGHRIIGILPTYWSGANDRWYATAQPMTIDMPFSSGLCVRTQSGVPGFTASFSVEVGTTYPSA